MELDLDKLEQIIKRVSPDARVAELTQLAAVPGLDTEIVTADLVSMDLDELRKTYLGDRMDVAADSIDDSTEDEPPPLRDDDDPVEQMVDIEYSEGSHRFHKTVLIDVENEEIIAEQG